MITDGDFARGADRGAGGGAAARGAAAAEGEGAVSGARDDDDKCVQRRGKKAGASTRARALSEGCGGGETPNILMRDIS